MWWVYVIQSEQTRPGGRPGFFYVGCTTEPARRILEHNGIRKGGGKFTSKWRPWVARSLHGPYKDRSTAMKAEYALKHGKRGKGRIRWSTQDSPWCRGEGVHHPWVSDPTLKVKDFP